MSLATGEQCANPVISTDYKEPQCIALDGDKLKPRTDQRKGGNGFGVNEDGAAYSGAVGGGRKDDVSEVLTARSYKGIGARNGEISGVFVAAKVQCYENHAQDSRVQGPIDTAPTQGSSNANSAGVSGNNPLVVSMAQNTRDEVRIVGGDGQIAGALPAEPGMKQQTYVVHEKEGAEGE